MANNIIKDGAITTDSFVIVEAADQFPAEGHVLISLDLWPELKAQFNPDKHSLGIKVSGDAELESFQDLLSVAAMVAIEFPVFRDGRGYSLARLVRERAGFKGELRAVGDVLRDQLFYLKRCGFTSFAVREDRSLEDALQGLTDFSVTYQADCAEPRPIYQRRP